jgi:hypothetical protein
MAVNVATGRAVGSFPGVRWELAVGEGGSFEDDEPQPAMAIAIASESRHARIETKTPIGNV